MLRALKERGGVKVLESANWLAMPSQDNLEKTKEVVAKAKEKFDAVYEKLTQKRGTSVSAKFDVTMFYEPATD